MRRVYKLLVLTMIMACVVSVNAQTLFEDLSNEIDLVVAADGSGDHTTVMGAINAAPSNSDQTTVIFIKNGSYYEKIIIPNDKPNLTLIGEDVDKTILWYDDRSVYTVETNTFTCHSLRVDATNVRIMNVTIDNPETGSQAVALHGNGDKQIFAHCRVTGWQDTYYVDMRARNYFKDCFIEGATDYIFGFGVALFDSCQIHSLGGPVTAASTPEDYKYGLVFRNSNFVTPLGPTSFHLGRPWFDYAQTVLIDCYQAETLSPAGWGTWDGRENTCFYAEYGSKGPGAADLSKRFDWSNQLTATEAAEYTTEKIFSADNFNNLEDLGSAEAYYTTGAGKDLIAGRGVTYSQLLAKTPILADLGSGDADIIKYFYRWAGHGSEPYLDSIVWRADGAWPVKPTDNWVPDLDSDPVYQTLMSHTKMFLDSANTVLGDFELFVDGEPVANFDTTQTIYGVELPAGSTEALEVSVEGEAFGKVEYPRNIPGYADVVVSPYNQLGGKLYRVYFSIQGDNEFTNAGLTSLTVNREEVLEEGVFDYYITMEAGETRIPFVRWDRANSDSGINIVRTDTVPGTTVLTVTAPDGVTQNIYNIHYSYPLSIKEDVANQYLVMTNPVQEELKVKFVNALETDVNISIYSLSGQKIKVQSFLRNEISDQLRFNVSDLDSGIYLTVFQFNGMQMSKRLIKE